MTKLQKISSPFPSWLIPAGKMTRVRLHVQPKASRSEIVGPYGDALKMRISAPPVDGKANREITRFLGKLLGIPKSSIVLEKGQGGRQKMILLPLSPEAVLEGLG